MSRFNAATELKPSSFLTEAIDCFGENTIVNAPGTLAESARYANSFKSGGAHTTTGVSLAAAPIFLGLY
jgi:hypothetical protein